MGLVELFLLALSLSMDAFAVSICKGLESRKRSIKEGLLCGVWFGGFQGLMPLIGYLLGSAFAVFINKFAHWLAFLLLAIIGINMLREAFSTGDEEVRSGYGVLTMFLMAVATSIDALAIGITFVAVPVQGLRASALINTVFACIVIAVITFLLSAIGVRIGSIFGERYKSGAEAAGGFILFFIGMRILLEHFGVAGFVDSGDIIFWLLIPFAGTIIGSALVFVLKGRIGDHTKLIFSGMAGGIMLACSVWTLLYPAINKGLIYTASIGFIIGVAFQYLLDKAVPHKHFFLDEEEGPSSSIVVSWKVVLSEIIHHIPEGMAVGVVYAAYLNGSGEATLPVAIALTIGIAVQNIPEGAFVSSPISESGEEKGRSFLMGVISGVVEPVLGMVIIILSGIFPAGLSFVMAFTAGAMAYLVIEETVPSMITEKHSDIGSLSFAIFFTLMMAFTFLIQ